MQAAARRVAKQKEREIRGGTSTRYCSEEVREQDSGVQSRQGSFASIVHAMATAKSVAIRATKCAKPFSKDGARPSSMSGRTKPALPASQGGSKWQDNWRVRFAGVMNGLHWQQNHDKEKSARTRTQELIEEGLAFERQLDPEKALKVFEEAYGIGEGELKDTARLRVVKNMADMSMSTKLPNAERQQLCTKAAELAQELVDYMPENADHHVALACCLGRLAIFSSNQMKVKLASTVKRHAELAETISPQNDLALHILGRWQNEAAQVNRFVRALIRVVYGDSLGVGSHQRALHYFKKAAELNPSRLVHRLEVGRTYYFLDMQDLAIAHLERAVGMDVEDVTDHHLRIEGKQLLQKLKKKQEVPRRRHSYPHKVNFSSESAPHDACMA